MTPPTAGERSWKTPVYSIGSDRHIRPSIRSQFTMHPQNPHGGIRCTHRVKACERSGTMHSQMPSWLGRSTRSRTWCVFKIKWGCGYSNFFQWLAPHDVRTGFYRHFKPGQPADEKIFVMGRITAVAPMRKSGLHDGEVNSIG